MSDLALLADTVGEHNLPKWPLAGKREREL
jgi:hypothetical protein